MKRVAVSLAVAAIATAALSPACEAQVPAFKLLHSFNRPADGKYPASLVVRDGFLYGATAVGGQGYGVVFKIDARTGHETILTAFAGGADGQSPRALVFHGGLLYGAALGGDATGAGAGIVFAVDPQSGQRTIVYRFAGGADGATPVALTDHAGMLYGMTNGGGAQGVGTVFSIDPATGAESILHSFAPGGDGMYPFANTLVGHGRVLFGATTSGGSGACMFASGCGTVFKIDLVTGYETVLYTFQGAPAVSGISDGAVPTALVFGDGRLYGTTEYGGQAGCGDYGCGSIFAIEPCRHTETVLDNVPAAGGQDGVAVPTGLTMHGGVLFGTNRFSATTGASGSGYGSVFQFDPRRRTFATLYTLGDPDDGEYPEGLASAHGALFGYTDNGGAANGGTVFRLWHFGS